MLSPELPVATSSWSQTFGVPMIWSVVWIFWIGLFQFLRKALPSLKSESGAWIAIVLTHLGSSQVMLVTRELAPLIGLTTPS